MAQQSFGRVSVLCCLVEVYVRVRKSLNPDRLQLRLRGQQGILPVRFLSRIGVKGMKAFRMEMPLESC